MDVDGVLLPKAPRPPHGLVEAFPAIVHSDKYLMGTDLSIDSEPKHFGLSGQSGSTTLAEVDGLPYLVIVGIAASEFDAPRYSFCDCLALVVEITPQQPRLVRFRCDNIDSSLNPLVHRGATGRKALSQRLGGHGEEEPFARLRHFQDVLVVDQRRQDEQVVRMPDVAGLVHADSP